MLMKQKLSNIAAAYDVPLEVVEEIAALLGEASPVPSNEETLEPSLEKKLWTSPQQIPPSLDSVESVTANSHHTMMAGDNPEEYTLDEFESFSSFSSHDTGARSFDEISSSDPGPHHPSNAKNMPKWLSIEPKDVTGTNGDYDDLGLLGKGGMGEVRRIRDRRLNRTLAMKVAHASILQSPRATARFVEEAQIGAQLQHPGVIPVHELGRLPDGRFYFTMQEIRGRQFEAVIEEVHRASTQQGHWIAADSGWNFRRLVNAFWRVCETMAYAHRRRIIHRDLKPANIMIGSNDEVLVVDWGLALALGNRNPTNPSHLKNPELDNPLETLRTTGAIQQTSYGHISGTPAYMPPEQAKGDQEAIDERADVYALGAILYRILSGRPPYIGRTPMAILVKMLKTPPQPPSNTTTLKVPQELSDICLRALSHDKEDRFVDARELADAVAAWLEGVRQREKALALVQEATEHQRAAHDMMTLASSLEEQGKQQLEPIAPFQPAQDKHEGWALKDKAKTLQSSAELEEIHAEQKLRGALVHDPGLPEAHVALSTRYERLHRAAETNNNLPLASRSELVLRDHVRALPTQHPERVRINAYLQGTGALTLHTTPPGVTVDLYRYVLQNRRLEPVFERTLGQTPLQRVELAPQSYLLQLRKPGFETVQYPVWIGREEHWDGTPPGGDKPAPIWMPPEGALGPQERYVPAGWFLAGDDLAPGSIPRSRLWCDGFVIEQHPITNGRLIAFLDDLIAQDRLQDALLCVPRERAASGDQGPMLYGRDENGRFFLQEDEDGDIWHPEYPAMMVNYTCAWLYARWYAEQTNKPWRLPHDFEWEKAARGVDGRTYPWGEWLDPSWCCMRRSHNEKALPATVQQHTHDISPYGVLGMAGNVMDMCLNNIDEYPEDGHRVVVKPQNFTQDAKQQFVCRGGAWVSLDLHCRIAKRYYNVHTTRQSVIGFRMARSVIP